MAMAGTQIVIVPDGRMPLRRLAEWLEAGGYSIARISRRTQLAKTARRRQTGPRAKNPHAAALGRLGGQKGGHARAARLTPERRRAIARKAAKARWGRRRG